MASAFGHLAVAYALGQTIRPEWRSARFWWLTVACCLLPDADVIGLMLGIPYEHVLGHRGLTHSLFFAVIVGVLMPRLAIPDVALGSRAYGAFAVFFACVRMSHPIMDAMTDGGLGIAFFAPFDSHRYFFPWRPITVSPIGITPFFLKWGLGVLWTELLWIGVPVCLWLAGICVQRRVSRRNEGKWRDEEGSL